jgi:glycopeptide antibiotics resistance protein
MAVECTQLLFKLGYFEIDDILHNCLGAMIGYGGVSLLRKLLWRIRGVQDSSIPVPVSADELS